MCRDMFNDVIEPSFVIGQRRRYTLPMSVLVHTAAIFALVIVPLLAVDGLPMPTTVMTFVAAPPAPEPPPIPAMDVHPRPAPVQEQSEVVPLEAPSAISPERLIESGSDRFARVDEIPGAVPGAIVSGLELVVPPAPPPEPTAPPEVVHVGSGVKPPAKIKDVRPIYPAIALASRVQGLVIIEATIGPAGHVENAKVLRSSPLLDAAALDAVRQWQFTPTLLNGLPVSVVMTVTVNFSLQN